MLDLTEDKTPLYEIKMLDGKILRLKRPTQALQDYLIRIYERDFENQKVFLNTIMATFTTVINRNDEGIVFNEEDFEDDYGIEIAAYVIGDYFRYWNEEINSKVSFR